MSLSESALAEARDALVARVDQTLSETGSAFPYIREGDAWQTTPHGNWCGGHWIGLLWFARDAIEGSQADRFERAAYEHTDVMRSYMPRNSMFCGMNFAYAGFGGYDRTGDRGLFVLGMEGADAMVSLYHNRARQIPIGELEIRGPEQFRGPESEHGPSGNRIGAVDNVYTALPVLWRSFEETHDLRFFETAVSHADRHLDWYVRDDGSTWHHAVFDAEDGSLDRQYNELAAGDDTCWARGQGWNVAGLARAYEATGASRYLDALERTVAYYRRRSPDNGVTYWDFEVPADDETPRDSSAAALISYGLCRLPGEGATAALHRYGRSVLEALLSDYLVTDSDATHYGAIEHGCFNKPGEYATDAELIWSNYYVARTIEHLLEQ
ncbi:glycoside hydrolase family 88 protein [Halobacteria archaeon AArc-m2/3/4]|uniref:Glycoside hydrolase family 88 protein n=1 Tax=Natronoglomus mannanivorans TaxID=2979990 RepID=A0ABT2QKJ3_9EURY|nr:glycoside hydrolase family 88 protein [Halobacteria archaeon AArc-m2/3/4]